jgi:D-alanyl-D-alanine carboxypeptidase
MRLISVVLGSTGAQARSSQTQTILDYGFRFFDIGGIVEHLCLNSLLERKKNELNSYNFDSRST